MTRFEVIDQLGRRLIARNQSGVELSYQDEGRTLKVFLTGEPASAIGVGDIDSNWLERI